MTAPLRVASFGAGWVTTTRHIPAMREHGGFEVAAIVDRRPERAAQAAARLGVPRHAGGTAVEDLDFAGEIDAVTCGTLPVAHHPVISSALRSGKHVLTEKPFTMTLAEGEDLAELEASSPGTLAIVHNFQFAKSTRKLRRWMAEGKIGRVRSIRATQFSNPKRRLPPWVDELPLGLFYDESPHLIYLVKALAGGELEGLGVTVHPSTTGMNTPALIDVQMRCGELPVTLSMNFEAPVSEWHVAVMGDEGAGVVDIFRDIAVYVPNDGGHRTGEVFRTSLEASARHWAGYVTSGIPHLRRRLLYGNDEVFRRFHDAARRGVKPDSISIDDALAVLRLQHWIVGQAEA